MSKSGPGEACFCFMIWMASYINMAGALMTHPTAGKHDMILTSGELLPAVDKGLILFVILQDDDW